MSDQKQTSLTQLKSVFKTKLPIGVSDIIFQQTVPLGDYTDKELNSLDKVHLDVLKNQVIKKLKENDKFLPLEAKSLTLNDVKFVNRLIYKLKEEKKSPSYLNFNNGENVLNAIIYNAFNILGYYIMKSNYLTIANYYVRFIMKDELPKSVLEDTKNESLTLISKARSVLENVDQMVKEGVYSNRLENYLKDSDRDLIRLLSEPILDILDIDSVSYSEDLELVTKYGVVIPLTYILDISHDRSEYVPSSLLRKAIEQKWDVNTQGKEGRTLLMNLANYMIYNLPDIENINLILDNDAKLNIQDNKGNTALHYFAGRADDENYLDLFERLIEKGADINIRNNMDQLPLDVLRFFRLNIDEDAPRIVELLTPKINEE